MKVYIIGAGPGDPELITQKGARLIRACPIVLYTGSLVPREVLNCASPTAKIMDSSGMTLEDICKVFQSAKDNGDDLARVHTGDPSLYGSTAEQIRKLQEMKISYEIIPGVSSFSAAAAALGKELTLAELSQTVIISRAEGRTPMPKEEQLGKLASHHATLVLFLSITLMKKVCRELIPHYGEDCPIAVVHRASMKDQKILQGTLGDIIPKWEASGIRSQSIILVGRILTSEDFADSRLYSSDFFHRFRPPSKS